MARSPGLLKTARLLVLCALAAALLLPTAAGAPGAPYPATTPTDVAGDHYEDHGPILIQSNAALLVPDAISGNGVRGGTGTAADPFVISGWRIEARGDIAVEIRNVDAHVLVRDLRLSGEGAAAVYVLGATNLTLQEVNASAFRGAGISVRGGEVAIEGGTFPGANRQKGGALRAYASALCVNGTRFGGGLFLENAGGEFTNIAVRVNSLQQGVYTNHNARLPYPPGARTLTFEDSVFKGPPIRYDNPMGRPMYEGTGIVFENEHYDQQTIRNTRFQHLSTAFRLIIGTSTTPEDEIQVRIVDNHFLSSQMGVTLGHRATPQDNITISSNLFGRNYFALVSAANGEWITHNRFHQNHDAILLHDANSGDEDARRNLNVRYNAFTANQRSAIWTQGPGPLGVVDARHNWWGSAEGPTVGDYGEPDTRDAVPPSVRYDPWLRAPPEGLPELSAGFEALPMPDEGSVSLGQQLTNLVPGLATPWALSSGVGVGLLLHRLRRKHRV